MPDTPIDLPKLAHQSTKMTGSLNDLAEAKEEAEATKPLVTVSVNNPLSWLMKVINKLKKKQTTTFTFRLGVPLIALPIIIAAIAGIFFGLGKVTSSPTPLGSPASSGQGGLKPTAEAPYSISKVGVLKVKTDLSYVLIVSQGNTLSLLIPSSLDISNMNGKRVLVTGMFDQQKKSLTVENFSDIELLRPIIPSPSPVESPINNEL